MIAHGFEIVGKVGDGAFRVAMGAFCGAGIGHGDVSGEGDVAEIVDVFFADGDGGGSGCHAGEIACPGVVKELYCFWRV